MQELILTAVQLDALREIGNVGAGNAAGALGEFLDKTVMIDVPKTRFLRLTENPGLCAFLNGGRIGVAHYSKITGAFKGGVLTIFTPKDSRLMSNALLRDEPGSNGEGQLSQIRLSALSESSYVFSCAYLNALSGLFSLSQALNPTIPEAMIEGAGNTERDEIKKDLLKKLSADNLECAISIENNVTIDQLGIRFFVSLLLDGHSVKKALEIVGL